MWHPPILINSKNRFKSYFDIQRKCTLEGMSVFLPSNQAEIDEVVAIIPSILKKEADDSITEDIYSGLYIRMSDMVSEVYVVTSNRMCWTFCFGS